MFMASSKFPSEEGPFLDFQPHYETPGARRADLIVHLCGLGLALLGAGVLIGLSIGGGGAGRLWAVIIYALGLLAMLGLSTAYNFSTERYQPVLRRLDHAGIFLMIAASYTPFTTHNLTGAWAWAMTTAVWTLAGLGALGKLFLPGLGRGFWVAIYIALSWLVLICFKPMLAHGSWVALLLLAIGGLVYTTGVLFYVQKRLKYFRAIWHGHVVAAASVHWVAVLIGVVLATHN